MKTLYTAVVIISYVSVCAQIEAELGLAVAMVPVDECSSSNKCWSPSSPGCTNVLVVEDAPLIVNANSTALVGVKAYVEAQCTCHALMFDRCTAGSCLNGGTCQQFDHTIRSVNISTVSPYNILLCIYAERMLYAIACPIV